MLHLHCYPSTASMVPHIVLYETAAIVLHLCNRHSSAGLAQAA
jgi:hypothetical protein